MTKQWIKEKLTAGDGSIRKLWGHRLMILGVIIVLLDIVNKVTIAKYEIFSLGVENISIEIYAFVFGTALTLLGVGNVTDIWKVKYGNGNKPTDTSK